jgi:hypothetical protein
MKEVECDFLLRSSLPDGRVRIAIGAEGDKDGLDELELEDGETILLMCPELEVEAIAESTPWTGTRFWYGIIVDESAIRARRERGA